MSTRKQFRGPVKSTVTRFRHLLALLLSLVAVVGLALATVPAYASPPEFYGFREAPGSVLLKMTGLPWLAAVTMKVAPGEVVAQFGLPPW